ncbi:MULTISPECIES: hypothetical protein [Gordonia]|uniref:hypothetical protein n=1 Tax=Gordonia TaxID=2053 RepID=UPI0010F80610|nr:MULTISPECIES: hypothetical protein [unclassified Gordonia (in: high G+C Gram-positive bacteria)]MCZ4534632.1 hypothetical protein [Gordonia terrae]
MHAVGVAARGKQAESTSPSGLSVFNDEPEETDMATGIEINLNELFKELQSGSADAETTD